MSHSPASIPRFQLGVVRALAEALEAKDPYTAGHSRRVAGAAVSLASALGLAEDVVQQIRLAANLHDVGKIGVPEAVLNKTTSLTPEEWWHIEQHPLIGANILEPLELDESIKLGVKHHHERFDGTGYPCRLRAREVPLAARVLQIADTWDAMTSDRPYRLALSPHEASRSLEAGAGSQFDPAMIEAYLHLVQNGAIRSGETQLLVLTNDQEALRVLRLCQDDRGLRVLVLDPAAGGIEQVVELLPDLLILDTDPSTPSSEGLYQQVVADPRTSAIPIALMVADDRLAKSIEPTTVVLTKPLVRNDVEARLRNALRDASTRPRSAPSRPIRLVLADDHTMFREGLRQLLNLEDGIEVIGEAQDGVDAEAVVGALRPDVIVMDINMPSRDGIETTRAIRARQPDARIVLLTMHQQDAFVHDARAAGAMGYLLKKASAKEIVQAVRTVIAGNSVYPALPKAS